MKAVCIKSYYDKCLHQSMTSGDELEVTEERFAELSSKKVVKKRKKKEKCKSEGMGDSDLSAVSGTAWKHPQGCYFSTFFLWVAGYKEQRTAQYRESRYKNLWR